MQNNKEPRQLPLLPPEWDAEILDALGAMPGGLKFVQKGWEETGEAVRGTNMLGTMAHFPELAKAWLTYNNQVVTNSTLTPRDREIMILRVGWLKKSVYEYHMHDILGRRVGLTDDEIKAIQVGPSNTILKEEDTVLVRAVDELLLEARLSDQSWEQLLERYSHKQIMDLIFLIGCYEVTAMYMNSFNIPIEASEPPMDPEIIERMNNYQP